MSGSGGKAPRGRMGLPGLGSLGNLGGMPELGAVKISDLASIVGPFKLPIERDLYFTAKRTLSEYTRLARINCSIID